jgi:flotillin
MTLSQQSLRVGGVLLVNVLFLLVFVCRFVRVKPDEVLVVSGMRQKNGDLQRIVLAGGTFVWPVLEQARRLSLAPIPVSVSAARFLADGHVRIRKEKKAVAQAAERFLSISPREIGRIAAQVVEGLLAASPDGLQQRTSDALAPMDLEVVSLTLKDRA